MAKAVLMDSSFPFMPQRLILFLLGLSPIMFLDLVRGSGGVQSGTTLGSLILFAAAGLIGIVFVLGERILRPLVPSSLRNAPMTSLALGLSLCIAAALPHLLSAQAELAFNHHFRLVVAYMVVSLLILYSIVVRIFGRLLAKQALPRRLGLVLTILIIGQLSISAFLEHSEVSSTRTYSPLAGLASESPIQAPARPNILLIVLDTLRFDTLRQEWQGQQHFPALDAFTKDAAYFERGYSGCNVTPGGHTTLLTGMFPSQTGTLQRGLVQLDERYLTVAEFLRSYGYRTGAVVSNARLSNRFGYEQGFEVYDDSLVNPVINLNAIGDHVGASSLVSFFGAPYSRKIVRSMFIQMSWGSSLPTAAKTSARALEVIDAMNIQPQEAWFLFLNYIDPHTPFITRKDLADAFGPGYKSPKLDRVRRNVPEFYMAMKDVKAGMLNGESRLEELNWLQEAYREQCLELDEGVDQFLSGLRAQGLLDDNTLILITSDHGEHLGEHQAFNHGSTLLDEEVRVPFLLMGPGIKAATISTPVSGADFFSTVCYALQLDENDYPETSGVPLQIPREGRVIQFEHGELRGFLQGSYKMIAHDIGGELEWVGAYDLAEDPAEVNNVIASGLEWVESYIADPPIRSVEDAGVIEEGDGSLDLGALGYADEVSE